MYIDVIEDMDAFSQLRENWDEVYDADPHATLFLSWNWLFPWLENLTTPWIVLAAKESGSASRYVVFFPLRLDTRIDGTGRLFNDLRMAGSNAADYTGLISIVEFEADAITAFAQQIKRMNWADLVLNNFCGSDVRSVNSYPASLSQSSQSARRIASTRSIRSTTRFVHMWICRKSGTRILKPSVPTRGRSCAACCVRSIPTASIALLTRPGKRWRPT